MKTTHILVLFATSLLMLTGCGQSSDSEKSQEYTVKTVPNPKRADATNFVSNPDSILSAPAVSQINAVLQSLEADTQAEVAVVMLNSIGDETIENFAVHLFEAWGIGKKGLDNGLLILFVLDQRTVRFEVGYGLEGILPDVICNRIQRQTMTPEFQNGDYDAGIFAGVQRVASYIREEPMAGGEIEDSTEEYFESNTGADDLPPINWHTMLIVIGIFYALTLFIFLFSERSIANEIKKDTNFPNNQKRYEAFMSSKKRQKTGLGCLTATVLMLFPIPGLYMLFAAFVDINYLFLGLIFCGSLLLLLPGYLYKKVLGKRIRQQPFPCPHCGTMMRCLSKKEDNHQYLTPSDALEDALKSVYINVFYCVQCQQTVVNKYDTPSDKYKKCPECQTKAFYVTHSKTVISASSTSGGLAKETCVCKFCNHTQITDKVLPRVTSSSGGGGSRSGRSSGRSGGSFGGGRSGGGGSSSRW
ncbi:hypothetical protein AGMMS49965_02290 [Bacteroidia bacterium]|nr:hypothetical protein AGMMS49965_02290 [Bacteroidia bacterium]